MGRRSLRKVDPLLDLSRHLKTPDELPRPWDAAALFGRQAPLEVEVGSGKGLFLDNAAAAHPGRNFLGIEIARKYARFAASRLAKHHRDNACMVTSDALVLFAELFPNESISAVHVYFPDPWWKKRHRKRRVLNEPFVRDLQRVLKPDGTFHFWSDVEEYFRESLDLLATSTALVGPFEVSEKPAQHPLDYRTHFERRMRLYGESVYRAEFRKSNL